MMRSMMSAVTGLRAQQTAMDVIANNMANVNTAGFKSSSTEFEDLFYQNLNGGSAEVNPSQVGYGSEVANVSKNMSSAGASQTDNPTDLYIAGSGYFPISTTSTPVSPITPQYFTRVGNFKFDPTGYLVDSHGNYVLGSDGTNFTNPIYIGDPPVGGGAGPSYKDALGNITAMAGGDYAQLSDISFGTDGSINASYKGKSITFTDASGNLLHVGLATFPNESGLSQVGNNDFQTSQSCGTPTATYATNGGSLTKIQGNFLEMSNVDMAKEFTTMISTQRGYQANSRVITVSDSMLDELINLKRS